MKTCVITAAVLFLAVSTLASVAQIVPFSDDFRMSQSDLDALGAVLDPILEDPAATPGKGARWRNEETGAIGTVQFVETLDLGPFQGCRKFVVNIRAAASGEPKQFIFDFCRVEDGTWKSYP